MRVVEWFTTQLFQKAYEVKWYAFRSAFFLSLLRPLKLLPICPHSLVVEKKYDGDVVCQKVCENEKFVKKCIFLMKKMVKAIFLLTGPLEMN